MSEYEREIEAGEHSEDTREILGAILDADEAQRQSGGGSRDWLEDHFIAALNARGYAIVKRGMGRDEHLRVERLRSRLLGLCEGYDAALTGVNPNE